MNKFIGILLLFVFISSCQTGKKEDKRNVVTVSILPQKTFVERIAGNDFKVNVLIPPGASPAAYTLLPSQLKDITRSVAWFRIGYIGFEYSWKDKISNVNTKMKVFDLSEGLNLIAAGEEKHGGHLHMNGVDPHVWLSPANVKKMVHQIKNVLSELNPKGAQKYQTNYLEFLKEIDQLDIQLRTILKDDKGKTIIVFHPSFTYFARDYSLLQVSLESGGKEPTAKHIREVVDLANAKNIKIVYIQTELDRNHARLFADEIKGEIIQISPLDPYWTNNLLNMAQTIHDNF